jgi:L-alanine-DL-glutamate epimerase-like enolase superfamily enzyme
VAVAAESRLGAKIRSLDVSAYTVPTDSPESDGTIEWDSTTIVVVEAHAGDEVGLGYTYGPKAAATLIDEKLCDVVAGRDVGDIGATWLELGKQLRNAGRPGIGFMAVAAVDIALWDLKARLLDVALVELLPRAHGAVPIYGSGGFCSYTLEQIQDQLGGWAEEGIPRVKMKVGRQPDEDPQRLDAARSAIGSDTELYVDANGAFEPKQALDWADSYTQVWDVRWFEEPVSSADFEGLRFVREHGPPGLDIAAGEYGYVLADFRNLLANGCVDCLQADVTRCGGISGLLSVSGLADGYQIDLSGHCAPALSAHALCAVPRLRHLEYFHDHVRIEQLLFDGNLSPAGGKLEPDRSRPGHGLELKRADAEKYSA